MENQNCIICEKDFKPWIRGQLCCSKTCMDKNRENYLKKRHKRFTCQTCGTQFSNTGKGVTRKTYCSKECAESGRKKINSERYNKDRPPKNCIVCDTDITNSKGRKYCSKECRDHGRRALDRGEEYKPRKEKAIKIKQEFIDIKGGECEICGYNKCIAAMTFHHRDPKTKEYTLDVSSIIKFKKELLLKELNKCDLLCFNCHMELHHH